MTNKVWTHLTAQTSGLCKMWYAVLTSAAYCGEAASSYIFKQNIVTTFYKLISRVLSCQHFNASSNRVYFKNRILNDTVFQLIDKYNFSFETYMVVESSFVGVANNGSQRPKAIYDLLRKVIQHSDHAVQSRACCFSKYRSLSSNFTSCCHEFTLDGLEVYEHLEWSLLQNCFFAVHC